MGLREDLASVRELGYSHAAGMQQPAQQRLREARRHLAETLPPVGLMVRASGSQQNLPKIPWIAILNPVVTKTAQSGLYVVYLFDSSVSRVYLTMNQGVTAHETIARETRQPGRTIHAAALNSLTAETAAIREALPSALLVGTAGEVDLGLDEFKARAYEAGTIAAIEYDVMNLPSEAELRSDLDRFLTIYDASVEALIALTASDPQRFNTPAITDRHLSLPRAEEFRPKDSSDYLAHVQGRTFRKTRSHEKTLESFGKHAKAAGWRAATNVHPRDLVLRSDQVEVLCEVKVVRGNSEFAVREAIGQLFTYKYFHYPRDNPPVLLAVFSTEIGEAFVELLEQLGIGSAWPVEGTQWTGSTTAADLGLTRN